jgi:hypothetical protein
VQAYWLPLGLRIRHSIELMVDSHAQASFYISLLFLLPAGSPDQAIEGNSTVSTEAQSALAHNNYSSRSFLVEIQ